MTFIFNFLTRFVVIGFSSFKNIDGIFVIFLCKAIQPIYTSLALSSILSSILVFFTVPIFYDLFFQIQDSALAFVYHIHFASRSVFLLEIRAIQKVVVRSFVFYLSVLAVLSHHKCNRIKKENQEE